MIVVVSLNSDPAQYFEDYNELFDCFTAVENLKLVAKCPNFKRMNWSFTIYSPKRVAAFYAHIKDSNEAIKEAFSEDLSLIEICTGDFTKPTYIALTPNVDLNYLKKKWCIDYCTFHHLVVREA